MIIRDLRLRCHVNRIHRLAATVHWRTFCATSVQRHPEHDIYDVVCVGGGPAGLALLTALKSNGRTAALRTALIDAQDIKRHKRTFEKDGGYSNRCSSLTPGSLAFLKDIGAWEHVQLSRTQPYHAMHVWDGVSGSKIRFDSNEAQEASIIDLLLPRAPAKAPNSVVATMTENVNLSAGLLNRLSTLPAFDDFTGSSVDSIKLGKDTIDFDMSSWPTVSIASRPAPLTARLLIGADGFNSPVRRFADIRSRGWDYDRHGVVATLKVPSIGTHRIAYQRFLPTGPVALLPLPDDTASLVWTTTPTYAAKLKRLPPTDFVAMVNAAFRLLPIDIDYMLSFMPDGGQAEEVSWRLPSTSLDRSIVPDLVLEVQNGSVASFPLRMRHADTYVGDRVALVGDAAHTIHPLAGQGLNQGLGDAKALAEAIDYALSVGWDIGSSWALDRYNAAQWGKNNAMIGTVDKLHKLYSAAGGPVVWARSLGLDAVQRMGWLKSGFMRAAAGQ